MRSTSKMTLAVLLAVLSVCAIVSASASAATCTEKAGSKNYQLCIAGESLKEAASIEAPTRSTSSFVLELPKEWEATIQCTSISDTATFKTHGLAASLGLAFGRIALSGCSLQGNLAKKCGVTATMTTALLLGKFESTETVAVSPELGQVVLTFTPAGGTESCPIWFSGTHSVSGSFECKLPQAKVEAVEHEVSCATSATHRLTTSGETDILHYTQMIFLGGTRKGQKFSVYEG
jgi:hypothetical protein